MPVISESETRVFFEVLKSETQVMTSILYHSITCLFSNFSTIPRINSSFREFFFAPFNIFLVWTVFRCGLISSNHFSYLAISFDISTPNIERSRYPLIVILYSVDLNINPYFGCFFIRRRRIKYLSSWTRRNHLLRVGLDFFTFWRWPISSQSFSCDGQE